MSDDRFGVFRLPMGQWEISWRQRDGATYRLSASEKRFDDLVDVNVRIGDLAGYGSNDWGLPEELPLQKLWHIQHVVPRVPKAYGGMRAILGWLAERVDEGGVWVTLEVLTHESYDDDAVMAVYMKYGGFKSVSPEFCRMLVRPPRIPKDEPRD